MADKLPMTEYEDREGQRIKLINHRHMAYLISEAAKHEPETVEDMLSMWGNAIYSLGQRHQPPKHLVQPLKVSGPKCRLCNDPDVSAIRLDDGVVWECADDCEQTEALATQIADRAYLGYASSGLGLRDKIYNVALNAIRRANR